jgi:hypothetical protein
MCIHTLSIQYPPMSTTFYEIGMKMRDMTYVCLQKVDDRMLICGEWMSVLVCGKWMAECNRDIAGLRAEQNTCPHQEHARIHVCIKSTVVCMSASSAWQDACLQKKHGIMSASKAWQYACLHQEYGGRLSASSARKDVCLHQKHGKLHVFF